jgi:hypothetical protein
MFSFQSQNHRSVHLSPKKENLISFSANSRIIRHNAIIRIESMATYEVKSAAVSFRNEGKEIKAIP